MTVKKPHWATLDPSPLFGSLSLLAAELIEQIGESVSRSGVKREKRYAPYCLALPAGDYLFARSLQL